MSGCGNDFRPASTNHRACRLCSKHAELQKSHILPAAAHRHTKNKGRNVLIGNRKRIFRLENQTDFAEYMLCFECEQLLSKFEGGAISTCREAWFRRNDPYYRIPSESVQDLIAFAYSVFWRCSVASTIEGYRLAEPFERELSSAFYLGQFPEAPRLAISISFLKVLDIEMTGKLIMTPLVATILASTEAHYFSVFGLLFRMSVPSALYELEVDEFLRYREKSGCIYPPQLWEEQVLNGELTRSAVLAKAEGARPFIDR